MAEITFELPDEIAMALAGSYGWKPEIEDTTQPLEGDEYPKIPNPVSSEQFIAGIAGKFISDTVLDAGRARVMADFNSIHASVEASVKSGTFDPLILAGDLDGIKAAVKAQL